MIECLNCDVHDTTKPAIGKSSMMFSICFKSSPISGVAINISFLNDVSIERGDLWNFNYYFVFVTKYYLMILLMIWSVWEILITC